MFGSGWPLLLTQHPVAFASCEHQEQPPYIPEQASQEPTCPRSAPGADPRLTTKTTPTRRKSETARDVRRVKCSMQIVDGHCSIPPVCARMCEVAESSGYLCNIFSSSWEISAELKFERTYGRSSASHETIMVGTWSRKKRRSIQQAQA